jgi:hypothetical protein
MRGAAYAGYLTPDGTKIIAPVVPPIPVGQTPPSCGGPPDNALIMSPTPPEPLPPREVLEEFSATTGHPVSIIGASQPQGAVAASNVYWSNPSGSMLVVLGKLRHSLKSPWVLGILSRSTFTPIPGSSSPPLTPKLAF